jgi:hypothetical protein
MSKKILLSLLAMILVVCVVISALFITGAIAIPRMIAKPQAATSTPQAGLTVDQQMDQIQSQVESFRGLELKNPLSRALMTPAELEDKVVNDFFKDYTPEDAASDVEILSALGLLAPDFDLLQFYKDLYSEQIAGYYDNETKEMYVISGESFGGMERMTYAHEFTHVLQDQTYDMENGLMINDDNCEKDTEYCAAVSALIEGDATFSEYYWFYSYATEQDNNDLALYQKTYKSPVYDSAPAFMKEDFLFPYSQGYDFVNTLYASGKWAAIDAAYANPPVTTEQILHPEKYPSELPIAVTVPDLLPTLGEGWQEVERNVMGEWYTYLILADGHDASFQLPQTDAKAASAGWGGDTYVYYNNPDSSQFVYVWESQWDSSPDADEFFAASATYGSNRWGTPATNSSSKITWNSTSDGEITIQETGGRVIWLMSPNVTVQQLLLSTLGFGN